MSVPDPLAVAGVLLVAGPVIGLAPVANPALLPVWSASRERHLAIVAAHRRSWSALNVGFGLATIATAAALTMLPLVATPHDGAALLVPGAIAYLVGGVLWCVVLAIRGRVTPLLGDMLAQGTDPAPAEALVGGAQGGLFAGFVMATGLALVSLGTGMLAGGIGPQAVAVLQIVSGLGGLAWLALAGDVIPAALYLPTIVLGISLLLGW